MDTHVLLLGFVIILIVGILWRNRASLFGLAAASSYVVTRGGSSSSDRVFHASGGGGDEKKMDEFIDKFLSERNEWLNIPDEISGEYMNTYVPKITNLWENTQAIFRVDPNDPSDHPFVRFVSMLNIQKLYPIRIRAIMEYCFKNNEVGREFDDSDISYPALYEPATIHINASQLTWKNTDLAVTTFFESRGDLLDPSYGGNFAEFKKKFKRSIEQCYIITRPMLGDESVFNKLILMVYESLMDDNDMHETIKAIMTQGDDDVRTLLDAIGSIDDDDSPHDKLVEYLYLIRVLFELDISGISIPILDDLFAIIDDATKDMLIKAINQHDRAIIFVHLKPDRDDISEYVDRLSQVNIHGDVAQNKPESDVELPDWFRRIDFELKSHESPDNIEQESKHPIELHVEPQVELHVEPRVEPTPKTHEQKFSDIFADAKSGVKSRPGDIPDDPAGVYRGMDMSEMRRIADQKNSLLHQILDPNNRKLRPVVKKPIIIPPAIARPPPPPAIARPPPPPAIAHPPPPPAIAHPPPAIAHPPPAIAHPPPMVYPPGYIPYHIRRKRFPWDESEDDTYHIELNPRDCENVARYRARYGATALVNELARQLFEFPGTNLLTHGAIAGMDPIVHIKHHMSSSLKNSSRINERSPADSWSRLDTRRDFFNALVTKNPKYCVINADFWAAADKFLKYVPVAPVTAISDLITKYDPRQILDVNVMFGSSIAALALATPQSAMFTGLCKPAFRSELEILTGRVSGRATFPARITLKSEDAMTYKPPAGNFDMVICEIRARGSELLPGEPPGPSTLSTLDWLAERINPILAKIADASSNSANLVFMTTVDNPDIAQLWKYITQRFGASAHTTGVNNYSILTVKKS